MMTGALTAMVKFFDVELCVGVCESVTVSVKEKVPVVGGFPLREPELLTDNQGGSPVPVTAKGETPPLHAICAV
jgi:hypothetical protein